jgi:hypothetical protein
MYMEVEAKTQESCIRWFSAAALMLESGILRRPKEAYAPDLTTDIPAVSKISGVAGPERGPKIGNSAPE